jgi:hypothetical protein
MKRAWIAAGALALAACSSMPPGEDKQGQSLKAAATPVLHALIKYRKEQGEYPRSLFELTPKYLGAIPFQPGLRYDRDAGGIEFSYERGMLGVTLCLARLGEVEWKCVE